MYQAIKDSIISWNASTTERQKLQHTYLAVVVLVVITAGLISLFSASFGHRAASIALIAITAFLLNAVVWNLLSSAVISRLPSKPRRK